MHFSYRRALGGGGGGGGVQGCRATAFCTLAPDARVFISTELVSRRRKLAPRFLELSFPRPGCLYVLYN